MTQGIEVTQTLTADSLNNRTRVQYADEEDRLIFYFDYQKDTSEDVKPGDPFIGEVIHWKDIQQLKRQNKWGVIRHPMVLNFINERLIDSALWYTVQILMFAFFLFLLSAHIFSKNIFYDYVITAMICIFVVIMVSKAIIKKNIPENRLSSLFIAALSFNAITYMATAAYIWVPILFQYDNYHEEIKKVILWLLPIIAIISAWINCLYILRKSPYGIYIFMMVRILKSFGHIATIWIPTLIAFSFAFHLIMRDSGIQPWDTMDNNDNATTTQKLFVILQAVTKTSTMMIGEVDANDILGTMQWIPSFLVLAFEIITVILLMNLMVSLAVGDVCDLRNTAEDTLLKIKVNFVIEALQISENFPFFNLHTKTTNNVLVIRNDGTYFTCSSSKIDLRDNQPAEYLQLSQQIIGDTEKAYDVSFLNPSMRVRIQPRKGRVHYVQYKNCQLQLKERMESEIPRYTGANIHLDEEETYGRRYAKWLIGINWNAFVDI